MAFVQAIGSGTSTTSSTSLAVTTTASVAAGDTILLAAACITGQLSSVSGGGLTWNVDQVIVDSTTMAVGIASAQCPSGLASGTVITLTFSASNAKKAAWLGEYAGSLTKDQVAGTTQSAVTAFDSGASPTTTHATEILFGAAVCNASETTFTAGSGYTARTTTPITVGASGIKSLVVEDQAVSATGTYHATGTVGTSTAVSSALVTYSVSTPPSTLSVGYAAGVFALENPWTFDRSSALGVGAQIQALVNAAALTPSFYPNPIIDILPQTTQVVGPNAAQGVVRIPFDTSSGVKTGTNRILVDASVTWASNVRLEVDSGVQLVDHTGSTIGMFQTTGCDNWSITVGDQSRNSGYWSLDTSFDTGNTKSRLTHCQNSSNFLIEWMESVQMLTASTAVVPFHSTSTTSPDNTNSPRNFCIRHWKNTGSQPGFGPTQLTSGYNFLCRDIRTIGGTAVRLETDAANAAGVHNFHVHSSYVEQGNYSCTMTPHSVNSDHGLIEDVRMYDSFGNLFIGADTAGSFTNITVTGGVGYGGTTAQNPADSSGATTYTSVNNIEDDHTVSTSISFGGFTYGGTFTQGTPGGTSGATQAQAQTQDTDVSVQLGMSQPEAYGANLKYLSTLISGIAASAPSAHGPTLHATGVTSAGIAASSPAARGVTLIPGAGRIIGGEASSSPLARGPVLIPGAVIEAAGFAARTAQAYGPVLHASYTLPAGFAGHAASALGPSLHPGAATLKPGVAAASHSAKGPTLHGVVTLSMGIAVSVPSAHGSGVSEPIIVIVGHASAFPSQTVLVGVAGGTQATAAPTTVGVTVDE